MRPVTRVTPNIPVQFVKTYAIVSPTETHTRPGTCEEAGCEAHRRGWRTAIDESTELGEQQAFYIRRHSGRKYQEVRHSATSVMFMFEAGQTCFAQHRIPLERPAHFVVRGGDWRGNPLGIRPRLHVRAEDWVEDFATHQQSIVDVKQRG